MPCKMLEEELELRRRKSIYQASFYLKLKYYYRFKQRGCRLQRAWALWKRSSRRFLQAEASIGPSRLWTQYSFKPMYTYHGSDVWSVQYRPTSDLISQEVVHD